MAIKIQTSKKEIPIELGEHTLHFIRSNENIIKVENSKENADKIRSFIEKKESLEEAFPDIDTFLKQAIDDILGEGSFEKVCDVSPDSIDRSWVYAQIIYGILEELEKTGDIKSVQQKAQKYIQNKK